jgi:hypothetical protein
MAVMLSSFRARNALYQNVICSATIFQTLRLFLSDFHCFMDSYRCVVLLQLSVRLLWLRRLVWLLRATSELNWTSWAINCSDDSRKCDAFHSKLDAVSAQNSEAQHTSGYKRLTPDPKVWAEVPHRAKPTLYSNPWGKKLAYPTNLNSVFTTQGW